MDFIKLDFSKLNDQQLKVADMVVAAANKYGIDPNLLLAQAFRESGFQHIPSADKNSDAFGVMQIRPSTAEQNKLGDTRDLTANIEGGARLMKSYLDKYKTPEAALLAYHQGPGVADKYIQSGGDLKSVGPKGLDYVISIGQNGGFGEPQKDEKNRYETIFGVGTPTESQRMIEEGFGETTTTEGEKESDSSVRDLTLLGASVGLLAGQVAKSTKVPTSAKYNAAVERLNDALARLTEAQKSGVGGQALAGLENEFRMRRGVATQAAEELKLAEAELKEAAPGRASGPKVAGASASSNYARALAGQQHQLPEALLAQVEDYTKSNPKGAHAVIQRDLENLRRIQQIGGGGFELSGTGSGQLMVLPDEAARRAAAMEAELAQRQAADAAERARLAQEAQAKAAAAGQRVQAAKQARRAAGTAVGEQSQAVKKAREDAKSVAKAQSAVNVAEARVARTPSGPEGIFGKTGEATAKAAPRVLGVVSGAATGYTAAEAINEWKKAHAIWEKTGTFPPLKEPIVRTLEALFGGMSMIPPVNPAFAAARGVGTIGGLGFLAYEGFKDAPAVGLQKAQQDALAAKRRLLNMPTPAPLSRQEAQAVVDSGDIRTMKIYKNDPQVAALLARM